jgi:hypothetical protein
MRSPLTEDNPTILTLVIVSCILNRPPVKISSGQV